MFWRPDFAPETLVIASEAIAVAWEQETASKRRSTAAPAAKDVGKVEDLAIALIWTNKACLHGRKNK